MCQVIVPNTRAVYCSIGKKVRARSTVVLSLHRELCGPPCRGCPRCRPPARALSQTCRRGANV